MVHNSRHVHLFVYVRCFLLAVYRWKETAKAYRLQLISLMVGQLVPIVTAFIYLMGFTPQELIQFRWFYGFLHFYIYGPLTHRVCLQSCPLRKTRYLTASMTVLSCLMNPTD